MFSQPKYIFKFILDIILKILLCVFYLLLFLCEHFPYPGQKLRPHIVRQLCVVVAQLCDRA